MLKREIRNISQHFVMKNIIVRSFYISQFVNRSIFTILKKSAEV